jgi:hypothetical protein
LKARSCSKTFTYSLLPNDGDTNISTILFGSAYEVMIFDPRLLKWQGFHSRIMIELRHYLAIFDRMARLALRASRRGLER